MESSSEKVYRLLDGHDLSPTHRRIAQYLIDNARDSIFLSSVQLAEYAGVSQASVVRFAVGLGFKGYPQLQKKLRELVGFMSTAPAEAPESKYVRALREEQANLAAVGVTLAQSTLIQELGQSLAQSPRFVVMGLRHSSPIATYFGYLAAKIHPDVHVVAAGGSTVTEQLLHERRAGADWLVCFALPRYPAELIRAIDYAKSVGFRIAIVSGGHSLLFSERCDVMIPVPTGAKLTFDTPVAPLMVIGMLLEAIVDGDPRRAQDRLDEEEQLVRESGIFLDY